MTDRQPPERTETDLVALWRRRARETCYAMRKIVYTTCADELEAALASRAAAPPETCAWTPTEGGSLYSTACGHQFAPDGDLDGFNYCYACGKRLRPASPQERPTPAAPPEPVDLMDALRRALPKE